ncbi:acyl-CoA thioesterase [Skermania sp. ID1734]|nr:acyl-CoA thioesterase [Skermania sp. ID1734]
MPAESADGAAKTFTCEVEVRWADLDMLGHVNNVKYLEYAMEARVKFYKSLFFDEKLGAGENDRRRAVVLRTTDIDYIRPILAESGPLAVGVAITHIGNSSYGIRHTLRDVGGTVCAVVNAVMVGFDLETQQARQLFDIERQRLSEYLITVG